MTANDRSRPDTASIVPLPSHAALDAYFLDARCKLLDLAALLDRIGRGDGSSDVEDDPRLARIRQALEVLHDASAQNFASTASAVAVVSGSSLSDSAARHCLMRRFDSRRK